MYLVISDTHIGDRHSDKNLEKLYRLLDYYSQWNDQVCLILNGDIIDFAKHSEFDSRHFIFFRILRKYKYLYYIKGNHDWLPKEAKERVPNLDITSAIRFQDGKQKIAILHGHQFDWAIPKSLWLSKALTKINKLIDDCTSIDVQRIFHKSSFVQNKLIPQQIKKCCNQLKNKVTTVICGHTHKIQVYQQEGIIYYNTGSWVDRTCAYLTIDHGDITLSTI